MKYVCTLWLCVPFFSWSAVADDICIQNETNATIYAAIYYVPGFGVGSRPVAQRIGEITTLVKHSRTRVDRPDRSYYQYGVYDRDIYFSYNNADLQPFVRVGTLPWVNAGSLKGVSFFIDEDRGRLEGFNTISWFIHRGGDSLHHLQRNVSSEIVDQLSNNPYTTTQAHVRVGSAVCMQEQQFVAMRLLRVKSACEQLLGMTLSPNEVPRIAWCCSGGGYRAMLSVLGSLRGAQKCNLFDTILYNATLSGSAWGVASWIQSGGEIEQRIASLAESLHEDVFMPSESGKITEAMFRQLMYTGRLTMPDFYGAILAQTLLRCCAENPSLISVTEQAQLIRDKNIPLPLYTAIMDCGNDSYEWLEFSPYEVGSAFLNSYVPLWAFGREFFAGVSRGFEPPQTLGYCLGIWGSILSANLKEILHSYQEYLGSTPIIEALTQAADELPLISNLRVLPAKVCNWTLGMKLPFCTEKTLTLLDAGIDFRLPFPPVLRQERDIDLIIVIDTASRIPPASDLYLAQQYARVHGLKFPPISSAVATSLCTMLEDTNDMQTPLIMYLPVRKYDDYDNTFDPQTAPFTNTYNSHYNKDEVFLLSGLAEHMVVKNSESIVQAIRHCVERRRKRTDNHQ